MTLSMTLLGIPNSCEFEGGERTESIIPNAYYDPVRDSLTFEIYQRIIRGEIEIKCDCDE